MDFLTKVPPEAWTGLTGVIVGSFLSILGVYLTNKSSHNQLKTQLKHEQQTQLKKLERERFEELHILVSGWLNVMASKYLSLSMVMQGKLTYDEHLDLFTNSQETKKYDFNRLKMITAIYAHHLEEDFQKILDARSELNEISRLHKEEYRTGKNNEKYLKPYTAVQLKIEALGETFKEKVAECVKNA